MISAASKPMKLEAMGHVSTPFSLQPWAPSNTIRGPLQTACPYRLATFGWWELRVPTTQLIQRPLAVLSAQGISVCSVTGLQVDLVMETVQASSYTWYGEVHRHGSGAGFLVANSLCERMELLPTLPHVGPRLARIRVASDYLQGVYAPYMGHCTVKQHKQFYQQVLESHLQLRKVAGSFLTWSMGDLIFQDWYQEGRCSHPRTRKRRVSGSGIQTSSGTTIWWSFPHRQRTARVRLLMFTSLIAMNPTN